MHAEVLQELRQIMGADRVVADETELLVYECDALPLFKNRPDVVVFPQTAEQVSEAVKVANR